jgi:CheY-like chemotaxis protein
LTARIHPSILRQILITALRCLAPYAAEYPIRIYAGLENGEVKITFAETIETDNRPEEQELIRDILMPEGVTIDTSTEGGYIFLSIEVPSVGKVNVLVVDDNPDMARFYRRSTEGTRYRIIHLQQGQELFKAINSINPDIIVLDVMLPDIDGWELLMRLHEDPETRPLPVVVCSVVREEQLAMSLGAVAYLAKPVRRYAFIETLDRILPQDMSKGAKSPANNGTTG